MADTADDTFAIDLVRRRAEDDKKEAMENCSILYSGRIKPPSKGLMCFGWECPDTWSAVLKDLSFRLEELNIRYYPAFRARIEAEQVKSKFGSLRFYYSVKVDPPWWAGCWKKALDRLAEALDCKDKFEYATVEDRPAHVDHKVEEITEDAYAKATAEPQPINADYFEGNARWYKALHYKVYQITHQEPTKRKFRYMLMQAVKSVAGLVDVSYRWPMTRAQRVVAAVMADMADDLIRNAEEKIYGICESCGAQVGTEWSPACVTTGWIRTLCCKCAAKQGSMYKSNGKLYKNGVEIAMSDAKGKGETRPGGGDAGAAAEMATPGWVC